MQNNKQVPYDKDLTAAYNSKYRFDHPHQFMAYSTWLEEIGDVRGQRVLDLACGGGTSTRMLSDRGALVTGVDNSASMLETAEKDEEIHPVGNRYILADASTPTQYSGQNFDIVVAAFLLHYANDEKVLRGMIENISLNLKLGGKFVGINLSPDHPIILPGKDISHSSRWIDVPFKDGSPTEVSLWTQKYELICTLTDYYWSKSTLERLFKESGFKEVKWVEVRMHEEGKKFKNWKELEKQNMLVIIEAIK